MSAGAGLTLITWLLVFFFIGINGLIKKVINSYLFWLIDGILCFSLFLWLRWIPEIIDYIHDFATADSLRQSQLLSKVFLLDICPWCCFMIHFSLIIDPSRKFAQILSPVSLFGALITISGSIPVDPDASWTIQYIFCGYTPNRAYFLLHFLNAMTATLVLLNTPRFTLKLHLWIYVVLLGYLTYISFIIFVYQGKIFCNVTGLLPHDWGIGGEYEPFTNIINIPYPWSTVFVYFSTVVCIIIISFMQYGLEYFSYWKYFNKKQKQWILGYYQLPILKILH